MAEAIEASKLALRFDNELPIRATDVASLLQSLVRDYKQLAPRGVELAISRLETGSLIAELTPYVVSGVATIVAVNALFELARNIAKLSKAIIGTDSHEGTIFTERRIPGEASFEAIARIASESHSRFRLEETDGERRTVLEVTPAEAREVPVRLREIRQQRQLNLPPADQVPRLPTPDIGLLLRAAKDEQPEQLRDVLNTMFGLLNGRPDGRRIIREIVDALRREGHDQAASFLSGLGGLGV